jgi:signal transduction histidine kinase
MEIVGDLSLAHVEPLDPELETTIYRLVQEALTNVAKHADASAVRVVLRVADSDVLLEIRDDGTGFDTQARTAGFGVAGMRERVYLAGGRLDIESGPGGTTLRAEMPVTRAASATESGANQMAS